MKIRSGFVANSSSSSFTCAICGGSEEVYNDDGPSEYWCSCDANDSHEYHSDCTKLFYPNSRIYEDDGASSYVCMLDHSYCPLCQGKTMYMTEYEELIKLIYGEDRKQLAQRVIAKFGSVREAIKAHTRGDKMKRIRGKI